MAYRLSLALTSFLFANNAFADPLVEFENIVARCKSAYASRPTVEVAYAPLASSWVKRRYSDFSFTYDVKKTDSLVSPFTAFIEITEVVRSDRAPDRESAEALPTPNGHATLMQRRLSFVFKGGVWEYSARRDGSAFKKADEQVFPALRYVDVPPSTPLAAPTSSCV